MKPIIQSEKRIVQQSLVVIPGSDSNSIIIARAKRDVTGLPDVEIGTTIKAVYCELWYQGSSAQPGTAISTLEKLPNDGTIPVPFGNMTALDAYTNKKNIFYSTQGIVGDSNSNPIPFVRQWIKIPKGKQRFGTGDTLLWNVAAQTPTDIEVCGLFIYKTYQ